MQTDKLVRYRPAGYPVIEGGGAKYLTDEFRKVSNSVNSLSTIMRNLETAGTVASKAGAVVAGDLADGAWAIVHDTTNATVGLYANLGGTLFKVMLT